MSIHRDIQYTHTPYIAQHGTLTTFRYQSQSAPPSGWRGGRRRVQREGVGTYFPPTTFRLPDCPYKTDIYFHNLRSRRGGVSRRVTPPKPGGEYRVKVESRLEALLCGNAELVGKNKTDFVKLNALAPIELNERLVTAKRSSAQLSVEIQNELLNANGAVTGVVGVKPTTGGTTANTKERVVNLAIGV